MPIGPFDAQSLTFPWRHPDSRVDDLQRAVMRDRWQLQWSSALAMCSIGSEPATAPTPDAHDMREPSHRI